MTTQEIVNLLIRRSRELKEMGNDACGVGDPHPYDFAARELWLIVRAIRTEEK